MDCFRTDNIAIRLDGTDPQTGILRGRAVLAKEGVYQYRDGAGNSWSEYVPMSTLTDTAWLDSLRLAPVTLNHPQEMVTADNARSLAVGAIGDTILQLRDRIASPVTVWDRGAVAAATSTHGEISLGYMATIEDREGNWNGQRYDRVQVARRANHVALVDKGRHGPEVALTTDAARMDGANIPADETAQEDSMKPEDQARLDAAAAEVAAEKARADAAETALTAEKTRADQAEAARDAEKARADAAEAAIVQAKADAIAGARARVELEHTARSVLGAAYTCDGKTDRELRCDALAKLGVTVPADRSDDYVTARFDAAIEAATKTQTAAAVLAGAMNQGNQASALPVLDANQLTRSQWAGK